MNIDLSEILPEELEEQLKSAAEISMGTEVSDGDINNIKYLCDQVMTGNIALFGLSLIQYLRTDCLCEISLPHHLKSKSVVECCNHVLFKILLNTRYFCASV